MSELDWLVRTTIAPLQLTNCNCPIAIVETLMAASKMNLGRKLRSYHRQSVTDADNTGAVAKTGGDSFHADLNSNRNLCGIQLQKGSANPNNDLLIFPLRTSHRPLATLSPTLSKVHS